MSGLGEVGRGWVEGLDWAELEGLECVWWSQTELGWEVWAGVGQRWVICPESH